MSAAHFAPALAPEERLRLILDRLEALGFRLEIGRHPTRSTTNPITRVITLQAGALIGIGELPLLAHELAHAERQGPDLGGRIWFGFAYAGAAVLGLLLLLACLGAPWLSWLPWLSLPGLALLAWSDRFRGEEEIEGEAHEAAMVALLRGAEPVASHRLAPPPVPSPRAPGQLR